MLTSLAPLTSLLPSGSEDIVHGGLTEMILGIENEWACIKLMSSKDACKITCFKQVQRHLESLLLIHE
jgi:hypothetical protein